MGNLLEASSYEDLYAVEFLNGERVVLEYDDKALNHLIFVVHEMTSVHICGWVADPRFGWIPHKWEWIKGTSSQKYIKNVLEGNTETILLTGYSSLQEFLNCFQPGYCRIPLPKDL